MVLPDLPLSPLEQLAAALSKHVLVQPAKAGFVAAAFRRGFNRLLPHAFPGYFLKLHNPPTPLYALPNYFVYLHQPLAALGSGLDLNLICLFQNCLV